jgi:hypothetical protein
VALILAVNPGNSHTPTLSRLARELKGCELIGADSCPTAIKAIKGRVPDLVLLPAKPPKGENDLLAQLDRIPGGVLTLRLPPVDRTDPADLVREIREMLTGGPPFPAAAGSTSFGAAAPTAPSPAAPLSASPQLIAGATAAINWIRTRRDQWAALDAAMQPVAAYATRAAGSTQELEEPEYYEPIPLSDEPYAPEPTVEFKEQAEPEGPSAMSRAAGVAAGVGGSVVALLRRLVPLAIGFALVAALVSYWPQISASFSGAVEQFDRPDEPAQPAETAPKPAALPPTPVPEPDPLGNVSGWVAVFAPFEVTISEGNQGVPVDDRGRAMLAPGRHRLRFQNRELGYDETRTVQVRPTDTTTVNLRPETTLTVASNEPAEVLIDGTRAGETPFEGRIGLGTHTVTVRTAGGERQLTIAATSKPVQLEVDFSKP